MSKNFKTTNTLHTVQDIVAAYNRRSNDILQVTPGGSVSVKKRAIFTFGRASINLIDACKGKKFILDEEKVNGRIRLVLKESFTSSGSKLFSRGPSGLDWALHFKNAEDVALVKKCLPQDPVHPRSPKFQAHFIEGHDIGDEELWIAILPAERVLV